MTTANDYDTASATAGLRRILLVGPYGLGNLLMAVPGIRALRESGRQVDIACLLPTTEDVCRSIEPLAGWFGTVYPLHRKLGWRALTRTVRAIRRVRYDAAVLLLPSMRAAYHLANCLLGARVRVAARYPGQPWHNLSFLNTRQVPIRLGLHDTSQTLRLLRMGLGIPLPEVTTYTLRDVPKQPGLVGIHPGCKAADAFKRWDLHRFTTVLQGIAQSVPAARFRVFFGPDEVDQRTTFERMLTVAPLAALAARVSTPHARSMAELFTLIGECGVMIANDSGLMHIAAAQGSICAGIFGPTDPSRTGPFSPDSTVIAHEIPCRPCALTNNPKSRVFHCIHPEQYCLTQLMPEQVLKWFHEWALPRWRDRGGLPFAAVKP